MALKGQRKMKKRLKKLMKELTSRRSIERLHT
jgi:hypothetical protein